MSPRPSIPRARELRREMTPPEAKLWKLLRHHRMCGLHWRRQHPIGPYFADFACSKARLVVELDGSSHDDRQDADANRDEVLRELGWTTLRFSNADFARSPQGVWNEIVEFLEPFVGGRNQTLTQNHKTTHAHPRTQIEDRRHLERVLDGRHFQPFGSH